MCRQCFFRWCCFRSKSQAHSNEQIVQIKSLFFRFMTLIRDVGCPSFSSVRELAANGVDAWLMYCDSSSWLPNWWMALSVIWMHSGVLFWSNPNDWCDTARVSADGAWCTIKYVDLSEKLTFQWHAALSIFLRLTLSVLLHANLCRQILISSRYIWRVCDAAFEFKLKETRQIRYHQKARVAVESFVLNVHKHCVNHGWLWFYDMLDFFPHSLLQ